MRVWLLCVFIALVCALTQLKFVAFCFPLDSLSDDIMFCQNPNFQNLAENRGLLVQSIHLSHTCRKELKFVPGITILPFLSLSLSLSL